MAILTYYPWNEYISCRCKRPHDYKPKPVHYQLWNIRVERYYVVCRVIPLDYINPIAERITQDPDLIRRLNQPPTHTQTPTYHPVYSNQP